MDEIRGQVDRRSFLAHAARVGAGATVAGSVPSLLKVRTTRAAAQGGQITVAIHSFLHDPLAPFLKDFTNQTGITVKLTGVPSSGTDQLTQLTPSFAAGTTPVDVLVGSDDSTPDFIRAGWLVPLDDVVPKSVWSDFPEDMMEYTKLWSSYNGHIYRIPDGWAVGYFWTRQDVLDTLGVKAPATWDALIDVGKKAKAKGMYVFADAASKPLAVVYAAYLALQSGGNLFSFDAKTRQAFAFGKELVDQGLYPRDALNWTYDQLNASYMNDKLVTMREWDFFWDVAHANKAWFSPKKIAIALPPAGPAGRATWAGAWGWTIPKFTTKLDQARKFVRFITATERVGALAQANSGLMMPRKSVLKVMGDKGLTKYLIAYTKAGVVKARPFHAHIGQAEVVIDDVFNGYLAGQLSLDQAMSLGKQRVEALGG
jgi:ABC-type glycerol-3-phosphate transport system substrate-binding protein